MDKEQRAAHRAAYHRKWSKLNPLKQAEINARYWARQVEKLKEGRPLIDVKG